MPIREKRPCRIRLTDFAGRAFTAFCGNEAWRKLFTCQSPDILLLGACQSDPQSLPFVRETLARNGTVYWLEEEDALRQISGALHISSWGTSANWHKIDRQDVARLAPGCNIYFHLPGQRLAPDFWGPILAEIERKLYGHTPAPEKNGFAWLPGNSKQLLHTEVVLALKAAGFARVSGELPVSASIASLEQAWQNRLPDVAISINFRGLDSEGHIFELCRSLGVPLAVWLVDNPWHLLSRIKYPWWRQANLFVTDASFMAPLRANGAITVEFCPLATAPHMWRKHASADIAGPPLFVGNSAFPDKKGFFSGLSIDPGLYGQAAEMLSQNAGLPDFHWWQDHLRPVLWPGNTGRITGFCADQFSAMNRARWIKNGLKYGLRIIGDAGWAKIIPETRIEPPVDYYGMLAHNYGEAACVLNVTSLLLPHSLNQRHFDVWAAGGLLLTDTTPGLEIFPRELTEEISLANPEDFPLKLDFFSSHPQRRRDLMEAWRALLLRKHLYIHRLKFIIDSLRANMALDGQTR